MLWFVSFGTCATVGLHMNERNDGKRNRNTWDRWAACASVEGDVAVEDVVVVNQSWVACWWKSAKHEHMLWRSWQVLLCSMRWRFKSNVSHVNCHLFNNLLLGPSWNAWCIFVFDNIPSFGMASWKLSMRFYCHFLSHLELNTRNTKLTLRIVNSNISHSCFIGIKNVFVELSFESAGSFSHTTPLGQRDCLNLVFFWLEFNWCLMDCQKLLIFHIIWKPSFLCKRCFDGVLEMRLFFIMFMLFVHQNGRREVTRKSEWKSDEIIPRSKWTIEMPNCSFVIQDFLMKLFFDSDCLCSSFSIFTFAYINLFISLETCLFLSFYLDFNFVTFKFTISSDENSACNLTSWIVVWLISLDVDVSTIKPTSWIHVAHFSNFVLKKKYLMI